MDSVYCKYCPFSSSPPKYQRRDFPFLALTNEKTLELLLQGDNVRGVHMNLLRVIFNTKNAEATVGSSASSASGTAAASNTDLLIRRDFKESPALFLCFLPCMPRICTWATEMWYNPRTENGGDEMTILARCIIFGCTTPFLLLKIFYVIYCAR